MWKEINAVEEFLKLINEGDFSRLLFTNARLFCRLCYGACVCLLPSPLPPSLPAASQHHGRMHAVHWICIEIIDILAIETPRGKGRRWKKQLVLSLVPHSLNTFCHRTTSEWYIPYPWFLIFVLGDAVTHTFKVFSPYSALTFLMLSIRQPEKFAR